MSLDVYLMHESGNLLYDANITHNLGQMAREAGIYGCLWRPKENGFTKAWQIVNPLTAGVTRLATEAGHFQKFDAPNGWGKWSDFLPWCALYLQACKDHPDALVKVSR